MESNRNEKGDSVQSKDLVVVLDHAGARIYDANVDAPKPVQIEPPDPSGHDKHVHNPRGDSGGQQGPHRKQFYEDLAAKLKNADRIVMIGDGHGASSEVDRFLSELEPHHADLLAKVVGKDSLDLHHLTEGELLASARRKFPS